MNGKGRPESSGSAAWCHSVLLLAQWAAVVCTHVWSQMATWCCPLVWTPPAAVRACHHEKHATFCITRIVSLTPTVHEPRVTMSPATETVLMVCREWRPTYVDIPAIPFDFVQCKQLYRGMQDVSVSAVTVVRLQEQLCRSDRTDSLHI